MTIISFVSACSSSSRPYIKDIKTIDRWNLSTWTDTQKQKINKKFLSIPSYCKTWYDYKYKGYPERFLQDLTESFDVINSAVDFWQYEYVNVNYFFSPIPDNNDNVQNVFETGLTLFVKGIKDGVTGSMTLLLRGTKKLEKQLFDLI